MSHATNNTPAPSVGAITESAGPAGALALAPGSALRPLFVPLYTRWYEQFAEGSKTIEYRNYGPRWNERTCIVGRGVVLSKGYGKQHRLTATITRFVRDGNEAQIHLNVNLPNTKSSRGTAQP